MHVDLSVVYLRVDYKPAEFQLWQGPFTKKIFFSKKLAVNGHKWSGSIYVVGVGWYEVKSQPLIQSPKSWLELRLGLETRDSTWTWTLPIDIKIVMEIWKHF